MSSHVDMSVIVPAHNGLPHLREQLDALAAQQFDGAWEVIVVDNRSTDGTAAVVHAVAVTFPVPLRVVEARERAGAAHARNRGALASHAEHLAFCDADDRVAEGWLAAAADGLREWDVVGGPLRELREPFDPQAPELPYGAVGHGPKGPTILTGNMAIRGTAYLRAGGLDESLPRYGGEDSEFSIRLVESGATIGAVPGMVLYFRSTQSMRDRLRKVFLSGVAQYVIWHKHPLVFGPAPSIAVLGRRLIGAPVRAIATYSQRGKNPALRELVTSVAHVWAALRIGRRVPAAILIENANAEHADREEADA